MRKTVEPPRFPALLIGSTLAVMADVAGLVAVFSSGLPLVAKLAIAAPLAGVPTVAVLIHVGRRGEWQRLSPRIEELEAEVQDLQEQLRHPAELRRAA